jgi:hypothetical protein
MAEGKFLFSFVKFAGKRIASLEHAEGLLRLGTHRVRLGLNSDHVETDGLGERAALTDCYNITFTDKECRRDVGRDVPVALLETVVLLDVVEVVTAHDDRALHLGRDDDTTQDTTADADVAGERTLLVDVVALNSLLGRLETKTNVLGEAQIARPNLPAELLGEEDTVLLLEAALVLLIKRSEA